MDWLGNNVKTFKVKGITIIANRNNGMVIGLDREGEEVVDLLKSNLIEISSLSDNQKELYKVLEENDFLKSCYKEIKGIDSVYLHVNSACNLHCLGCYSYVENRNTRNELSFDECRGRAYLFTGDMKKRDPYCLAAKRFYDNLFAQYTSI